MPISTVSEIVKRFFIGAPDGLPSADPSRDCPTGSSGAISFALYPGVRARVTSPGVTSGASPLIWNRFLTGGIMDLLAAIKREERKLEKELGKLQHQLTGLYRIEGYEIRRIIRQYKEAACS
jgi:hypothetical protein